MEGVIPLDGVSMFTASNSCKLRCQKNNECIESCVISKANTSSKNMCSVSSVEFPKNCADKIASPTITLSSSKHSVQVFPLTSAKIKNKNSTSKTQRHVCNICNVSCRTLISLKVHKRTHSSDHPFQCDKCLSTFKAEVTLLKHKQVFHSDKRPFECSVCNATFKTASILQKPEKLLYQVQNNKSKSVNCEVTTEGNSEVTVILFTCNACNLILDNTTEIVSHQKLCQAKEYSCKFCNLSFQTSENLQEHIQNAHISDVSYFCKVQINCRFGKT